MDTIEGTHESVQKYYGQVLHRSGDLKTNACCSTETMPEHLTKLSRKYWSSFTAVAHPFQQLWRAAPFWILVVEREGTFSWHLDWSWSRPFKRVPFQVL